MIVVKNLSYAYNNGEEKVEALRDLSFTIPKGQWVAVCGHNGSGKSTLAKLLDGLLEARSGVIEIDGLTLSHETVYDVRSKIGMVFQNPDNQFVGVTVEDDVAFGLENQGVDPKEMQEKIDSALELVSMKQFAGKEPSRLSGGQKQRVAIASVLAQQPKIIILDEATAMLDPKGRQQVLRVVQELKQQFDLTVLSITHDIEEVLMADRAIVLQKGTLQYDGDPKTLFSGQYDVDFLGLAKPYERQIYELLQEKGVALPKAYMTMEELEEWLCQSLLTK
ncbi:energy-coupling factor transporter ATPase [Carnobacteriaceae bacterium zg-ZUI252]|nr:energy-coupling factor transporter ATPase [Carnobacteriaceae bacterium zg-ZUI252]